MKGTRTTRFPRTAALAAGVVAGVAAWAFAPPAVQAEDGAPTTTAGADVEGLWRLEGRRLGAATWREQTLTGGRVRLWREGGALRYERAVRDATEAEVAAAVERGTATLTDGGLVLRPAEGPARLGLTKRLDGRGPLPSLPDGPAATTYRRAGPDAFVGRRTVGERRTRERLTRWDPARDGNAARLLVDGEAFASMEAAIRSAERTIDVQTFQWADDPTGRRVADLLMAKAREGVRVRCLVDGASAFTNRMVSLHMEDPKVDVTGAVYRKGWGKKARRPALIDALRAAGVEVEIAHTNLQGVGGSFANVGRGILDGFRRLFGGRPEPRERRGFFNHDHRKILIVDERVGFCGGMNIAAEYEHDWHDIQARVEGPAAYGLHELFVDRWAAAGHEAELEPRPAPGPAGDVRVDVLGSVPGIDASIRDWYLEEIRSAEQRILIEVAYFLDDRVIAALQEAAGRGVRTVVIVPSDEVNDVYLVKESFAWVHNAVVRSGIELYFYQPRLSHSKVAAFDGVRSTVGSSNLDELALDKVAEANLVFHDERFTRELERRVIVHDLALSERAQVRELGFWRKLRSGFLRMFRGVL